MLTFDEAVRKFAKFDLNDSEQKRCRDLKDVWDRYKSIADEAELNINVQMAIISWLEIIISDPDKLETALFSCFMYGLITGSEMQKVDL